MEQFLFVVLLVATQTNCGRTVSLKDSKPQVPSIKFNGNSTESSPATTESNSTVTDKSGAKSNGKFSNPGGLDSSKKKKYSQSQITYLFREEYKNLERKQQRCYDEGPDMYYDLENQTCKSCSKMCKSENDMSDCSTTCRAYFAASRAQRTQNENELRIQDVTNELGKYICLSIVGFVIVVVGLIIAAFAWHSFSITKAQLGVMQQNLAAANASSDKDETKTPNGIERSNSRAPTHCT